MDTIENELKELILSKYKSLREFTLKIEMPYSTLDTILKRGVDKANIINILKICNELNISANKLAIGIIEYINTKNNITNNNLSKEETTLLENYNKLDSEDKNKVVDYTTLLSNQDKYKAINETNDEITATKANVINTDNNKEDDEFTKVLEARRKAEQYFKENPHLMPIASHDKEGDFTEEDYKHDDDIMTNDDLWK